jgi:3-oxoadipate enol-lactonase
MQKAPDHEIVGHGAEIVIFVPALGTTREMWAPQVTYFEPNYRVVSYDAGGHYPSHSLGRSLSDFADELRGLLVSIGALRPHIVGISMGGMIAQEFAIRHPTLPASIVLVNTTPFYPPEARQQIELRAQTAERDGFSSLVEPTLERWFTAPFREKEPQTVDRIRRMLHTADPHAYAEAARAVAAIDTRSRLDQIRCSTLIIRAEKDASMPTTAAQTLHDQIRDSRLAEISQAAHLCSVEQPDQFNQLVSQFVGSLARS